MEYENVIQKFLFGNDVLAALMSGRIYDVIIQNGDFSRESNVCTSVFRKKVGYRNPARNKCLSVQGDYVEK
jgi:hypothetical protein